MRARHLATAFIAAVCTSAVCAQSSIDRSFTTTSNNCDDVQWSQEVRERYSNIDSACQSVEERNGKKYVKFEGTVRGTRDRGSAIDVDFKGGGRVQMQPPQGTKIYMEGRQIPVAELRRGDRLTFYVPEDRMTAQFYPDEQLAGTQEAQAVNVPLAAAEQATTEREQSEQMAGTLPSTASDIPLLAVLGIGMLGLAGSLRWARRR